MFFFLILVHDEHTGDIKSQKETAHDGHVEGHYSLIDADGHKRIVHYTANDHDGFNAKVEREYLGHQYEAPKQVKYVAPALHKIVAPVHKVVYDHQDYHHHY